MVNTLTKSSQPYLSEYFYVCVLVCTSTYPTTQSHTYTWTDKRFRWLGKWTDTQLHTLGQVLVQFMMVWQRYTEKGSRSFLSLSSECSSRESMIQRYACISTAGPRYLSPFHQYEGHEVEQQAHRMHSYSPSWGDTRQGVKLDLMWLNVL